MPLRHPDPGVAMFLYWLLIIDLSIFSMQISAFVLVCGRVLSELALFLTRGWNSKLSCKHRGSKSKP